jgi:hypothetical protein
MSEVPNELLPDAPMNLGSVPCEGCGKEVPPPGSAPDQHGQVLYEDRRRQWDRGPRTEWRHDIDRGNWHLECALRASPRIDRQEPLLCLNCKGFSPFHVCDKADTARVCIGCGQEFRGAMTKAEHIADQQDGGEIDE